jgi:hypothetical protein
MPHATLHRLAAEMGPDDRNLTFVNMTARCGSTLLCQIMSRVPGVQVMSEPYGFVHLHGYFVQGRMSMEEYTRLLKSYVRVLCKQEVKNQEESKCCSKSCHYNSTI